MQQLLGRLDDDEVVDLGTRTAQDLGNSTGCSLSERVGDDVDVGDEFEAGFAPGPGVYLFIPVEADVDVDQLRISIEA